MIFEFAIIFGHENLEALYILTYKSIGHYDRWATIESFQSNNIVKKHPTQPITAEDKLPYSC